MLRRYLFFISGCFLFVGFTKGQELRSKPFSNYQKLKLYFYQAPPFSVRYEKKSWLLEGSLDEQRQFLKMLSTWVEKDISGVIDPSQVTDFTDFMPESFRDFKKPFIQGANCHNASLRAQKLVKRKTFVGVDELKFYLKYFCNQVDRPKPGDLVIYELEDRFRSHSFTYISEQIIFEKASMSRENFTKFRVLGEPLDKRFFSFYHCERNLKRAETGNRFILKLDVLHSKLTDLISSLKDASERKKLFFEIKKLKDNENIIVQEMNHQEKEFFKARLDSMLQLSGMIQSTGAIYGKGSYDRTPVY